MTRRPVNSSSIALPLQPLLYARCSGESLFARLSRPEHAQLANRHSSRFLLARVWIVQWFAREFLANDLLDRIPRRGGESWSLLLTATH